MGHIIRSIFIILVATVFTACGRGGSDDKPQNQKVLAYFGDRDNDAVIVADVTDMKLLDRVYTGHKQTHTVDIAIDKEKGYIVNRGSDAIDVLDLRSNEIVKTINLHHNPRTADALNISSGLIISSGEDRAMASLIDVYSDEVIAEVGSDELVDFDKKPDHGGVHATGHSMWLDKNHFVLIDRYAKKIVNYVVYKSDGEFRVEKINEVFTKTSVHHIISQDYYMGSKDIFYAIEEGSDRYYPAISVLKLTSNGLKHIGRIGIKDEGVSPKAIYLHHGNFVPNKHEIYVGGANGELFIVDYKEMKIKKILKAGKGAGHTLFIPERTLSMVINHKDNFVTFVDTDKGEKIKDLKVSKLDFKGTNLQSHMNYYISKDAKFAYIFLTADGKLIEIDLDKLEISRLLVVGGHPTQGNFVEI
jgi:6-phosphogluconolactonase (cycloisomerase 2 family)